MPNGLLVNAGRLNLHSGLPIRTNRLENVRGGPLDAERDKHLTLTTFLDR